MAEPVQPFIFEQAASVVQADVSASAEQEHEMKTKIESYKTHLAHVIYALIQRKTDNFENETDVTPCMRAMAADMMNVYDRYGLDYLDKNTNQFDDASWQEYERLPRMSFKDEHAFAVLYTLDGYRRELNVLQTSHYFANVFMPQIVRLLPYAPNVVVTCMDKSVIAHNMSVDMIRELLKLHPGDKTIQDTIKFNPYVVVKQPARGTMSTDPSIMEQLNRNIETQLEVINRMLRLCHVHYIATHMKPKTYDDIRDVYLLQQNFQVRSVSVYDPDVLNTANDMSLYKYIDVEKARGSDNTRQYAVNLPKELPKTNPDRCPNRQCGMLTLLEDEVREVQAYITYCPYVVVSLTGESENYLAIEEIRVNTNRSEKVKDGENILLLALLRAASKVEAIKYAVVDFVTEINPRGKWNVSKQKRNPKRPEPTKMPSPLGKKLKELFNFHYTYVDVYNSSPFAASGSAGIPKRSAILSYNYIVVLHNMQSQHALDAYVEMVKACDVPSVTEGVIEGLEEEEDENEEEDEDIEMVLGNEEDVEIVVHPPNEDVV